MLRRFLKWNHARREWNREHVIAWASAKATTASGFTPFQLAFEPMVTQKLAEAGVGLTGREVRQVASSQEHYISAQLAGTPWTLWVYADGAEITSDKEDLIRMEEWDAKTPEDFMATFVDRMMCRLRSHHGNSV